MKLWLSSISGCDDNDDITEISDAVDIAFDELDRGERSLSTIHEATFSPGSRIRKELAQWVSETGYGPIFNSEYDAIDIEDSWLTTFDMTKLLEDPKLGAATVHYLMHKIRDTMRRNEAPALFSSMKPNLFCETPTSRNYSLFPCRNFGKSAEL